VEGAEAAILLLAPLLLVWCVCACVLILCTSTSTSSLSALLSLIGCGGSQSTRAGYGIARFLGASQNIVDFEKYFYGNYNFL
jgi:hypothetical protein